MNAIYDPKGKLVYRIIHKSNLQYILQHGQLTCNNHPSRDPDYYPIGNNAIIAERSRRSIPCKKDKTFGDYIAFYIGPRSIMLYNIVTGLGVPKIQEPDIVYVVCKIEDLDSNGYDCFYTDGQGNQTNTQFFTDIENLDANVDLDAAYSTKWGYDAEKDDPDIKRKKHAEFHVYNALSLEHIDHLAVCCEDVQQEIQEILSKMEINIPVYINPTYYYNV